MDLADVSLLILVGMWTLFMVGCRLLESSLAGTVHKDDVNQAALDWWLKDDLPPIDLEFDNEWAANKSKLGDEKSLLAVAKHALIAGKIDVPTYEFRVDRIIHGLPEEPTYQDKIDAWQKLLDQKTVCRMELDMAYQYFQHTIRDILCRSVRPGRPLTPRRNSHWEPALKVLEREGYDVS